MKFPKVTKDKGNLTIKYTECVEQISHGINFTAVLFSKYHQKNQMEDLQINAEKKMKSFYRIE